MSLPKSPGSRPSPGHRSPTVPRGLRPAPAPSAPAASPQPWVSLVVSPFSPSPLEAPQSSVSSPGLAVVAAMAVDATAAAPPPPQWEEPPPPNREGGEEKGHSPEAAPPLPRNPRWRLQQPPPSQPLWRRDPAYIVGGINTRPPPRKKLTNEDAKSTKGRATPCASQSSGGRARKKSSCLPNPALLA